MRSTAGCRDSGRLQVHAVDRQQELALAHVAAGSEERRVGVAVPVALGKDAREAVAAAALVQGEVAAEQAGADLRRRGRSPGRA
jgi:hypothetical protein